MTEAQFQAIMQALAQQTALLHRIAVALETQQAAPNYTDDLTKFSSFDWSSINATVEIRDPDGVAAVQWRGNRYTRRSASNKFQPAIWFSRSVGKDEQGNNCYERLITFKPLPEPEPLPEKVRGVNRV